LAGVHHRQALHQETLWLCVAWQSRLYRQAVPLQEPKNNTKQHESPDSFECPPGGLWKISRNPEFQT